MFDIMFFTVFMLVFCFVYSKTLTKDECEKELQRYIVDNIHSYTVGSCDDCVCKNCNNTCGLGCRWCYDYLHDNFDKHNNSDRFPIDKCCLSQQKEEYNVY